MKRHMDLIRLLLFELEGEQEVGLSGYTHEQKLYHKYLLLDADLAEGQPHFGDDRLLAVNIFWLTGRDMISWQQPVMKRAGERLTRRLEMLLSTQSNKSWLPSR